MIADRFCYGEYSGPDGFEAQKGARALPRADVGADIDAREPDILYREREYKSRDAASDEEC